MSCLACGTSVLRTSLISKEVSRAGDVCARHVRCATAEASTGLLRINSSTPRKQPASSNGIGTFRWTQVSGRHTAFFSIGKSWRRKEPSHRDKSSSTLGVNQTLTAHGNPGRAPHIATIPVPLSSRRGSISCELFLKSRCRPQSGAFDKDWLVGNLKGRGRRNYTTYLLENDSMHYKKPESFKLASSGRRARIRDYSRTSEESKGATIPARSAKVSVSSRIGTQRYKDQREPWQTQKKALSEKFGSTGWLPRKRLSPDTLEGIRALHGQYPDRFTTPILADQFKVSPEAIRRILKSKWRPNDEEEERRRQRWEKRGLNIWSQMVEMGIKPPKKWRDMGVGKSRERKPAGSKQLESRMKSEALKASLPSQSIKHSYSVTANRHKNSSPVLLADRIL